MKPHMLFALLLLACGLARAQAVTYYYDLIGVQGDSACNTVVVFKGNGNSEALNVTVVLNDAVIQSGSIGVSGKVSFTVAPGTANYYWFNIQHLEQDKEAYRWTWELSCTPSAQSDGTAQAASPAVFDTERLKGLVDQLKELLKEFTS